MKASEIREMSLEQMRQKHVELKEACFNLRFQHGIGQLENPKNIQKTKRDIARIKTLIRENQLKDKTEKE